MTALPKHKKYTAEEYLALEAKAEYRSEFEDGEIVAMAGAKFNHIQITSNVSRFIGNKIAGNCSSLPTDMKVWVKTFNRFYYPDVTVFCGDPEFYRQRTDTIVNPILIVEVLSDSTEAKDRGKKFFAYQMIESLHEYVLISQDRPIVERFTKQSDGSWLYSAIIGLDSKVNFQSIDVELTLSEIFQRVIFKK